MAIVVFCAAALVGLWAAIFVALDSQRELAIEAEKRELSNLAFAFSEHTTRTLAQLDQLAAIVQIEYGKSARPADTLKLLEQLNLTNSGVVHLISVVDRHGALAWSTRAIEQQINVADREHFRVHLMADTGAAFVSRPLTGRRTGKWTLPISRRINHADGSFAGVAVVMADPYYFTATYRKVGLGEHGVVMLVGTDGIVRAAHSAQQETVGNDISGTLPFLAVRGAESGTVLGQGPTGAQRLWAFERIEGFPSLALLVGVDLDEVLIASIQHRRTLFVAGGVASLFIVGFCILVGTGLARRQRAAMALQDSEERFRYAVSGSQAGIWDWDCLRGTYYLSPRFKQIFGYRDDEFPNDRAVLYEQIHPDDRARVSEAVERHFTERVPYDLEFRMRRKDGTFVWVRSIAQAIWTPSGEIVRFAGSLTDITDRKRAEEHIQYLLAEQSAIFEATTVGIAFLKYRVIVRCNPRFAEIFGYDREELLGATSSDLNGSMEPFLEHGANEELHSGVSVLRELEVQRKDGAKFWIAGRLAAVDPADPTKGAVWSIEDITERKQIETRLVNLAHYDSLTGLPNRILLGERLAQALAAIPRTGAYVGLLFIDLDRFKLVNDTLGHAAGDELLQQAAARLRAITRATDTVARLGGDEFAVVLSDMRHADAARQVAEKVLHAFSAPFGIGAQDLHVTTSIGIAVAPSDGARAEELIKNADIAMYRAKSEGRNGYRYYTPEMNVRALGLLALENDLRRAVERGEFRLHYQPRVELRSGRVTGVEALLRWQKDGTLVSPGEFIPMLEETGLIVAAGEWVLREACLQAVEWSVYGLRVAVNVSARQFACTDFAETVERVLAETGLEAGRLDLELTESTVMQDAERTVLALRRLKECGVRIAIDDFGTGYSSLSYLKRFAVDELKVDRSFVMDLPDDANDAALTTAIIAMAHSLGIVVTAEGVETEAQRAFLARNNCDEYQGFLFSRPLPAASIPLLLEPAANETLVA